MDILPYEFARVNRVLWRPQEKELIVAKSASVWAIAEINRLNMKQKQLLMNGSGKSAEEGAGNIASIKPVKTKSIYKLALREVEDESFDEQLKELYRGQDISSESVMQGIQEFVDLEEAAADVEGSVDLLDSEKDAPIIRLLNAILAEALKKQSSDIHIEPYEKEARVRLRLDGVLRTILTPSAQIVPLLISRIKVMSKLDIAEKRLPQDGRMSVRLGGRSIDLRISTIPASHGERVVLRLLDKDAEKMQVSDLGMPEKTKKVLGELINRPHGIILVTGPTGSGKTTTLYAALQQMDRLERNIMTVEDPVEYDLPGISQTQINLRAGMSFARGLRAILRQDPDVILIGEIRDGETADVAAQASLTGHLVLSTLHTNTAAGAITRMQDIGVDSFLLASTIRGIVAQRLVRRLCSDCRVAIEPDEFQLKLTGLTENEVIYQANGCSHCNNTGFQGRQALFELVVIDAELQSLIHENVGELALEKAMRKKSQGIRDAGFEQVCLGTTTIDEVLRVTSV